MKKKYRHQRDKPIRPEDQDQSAADLIGIRLSRPDGGDREIEIWCGAVDATHDFLTPEDRPAINEMACGFLPQASLRLAVDEDDYPLAFMLIDDGHMEALVVDPVRRGTGIGAAQYRSICRS